MASERAGEGPLRRDEIEAFAADWYHKLDEHVPAADIMPLVLDQGLGSSYLKPPCAAAGSSATGTRAAAVTRG